VGNPPCRWVKHVRGVLMTTTHAKLYVAKSEWTDAKNTLETALGIPAEGTAKYCDEEQVRSDHPEHADKYILPIETGANCQWRTDHLVTGEIPYDRDWHETPPDPFE